MGAASSASRIIGLLLLAQMVGSIRGMCEVPPDFSLNLDVSPALHSVQVRESVRCRFLFFRPLRPMFCVVAPSVLDRFLLGCSLAWLCAVRCGQIPRLNRSLDVTNT
jgi:hypothetical protein